MDDKEVLGRINELAREEHELFERESHGKVTDADRARLRRLEVTLDQCWDLLRQRRARRAAGLRPGGAPGRGEEKGEGYTARRLSGLPPPAGGLPWPPRLGAGPRLASDPGPAA